MQKHSKLATQLSAPHTGAGQEMLNNEFKLLQGQALFPAQLARDACAKRGSHMGVESCKSMLTDRLGSASCYARTRLNVYLLKEPKGHTAPSCMPTRCVIGRLCHRVTVCQVARYRSFFTV